MEWTNPEASFAKNMSGLHKPTADPENRESSKVTYSIRSLSTSNRSLGSNHIWRSVICREMVIYCSKIAFNSSRIKMTIEFKIWNLQVVNVINFPYEHVDLYERRIRTTTWANYFRIRRWRQNGKHSSLGVRNCWHRLRSRRSERHGLEIINI